MTTLLGISGSLRKASTNTKLMRQAAAVFAPEDFIEADLNLPLYNGDLEEAEGIPQSVQTLADQIAAADVVVIATPEYNKAPPGVLKNALDWVSRTKGNPWKNKPVAIMSAAAGRAGGERSQFALRLMMTAFRPDIIQGPEMFVANSGGAFDDEGKLTDDFTLKLLTELMDDLKARIRS